MSALLEVKDLRVTFPTDEGDIPAVRGVDFAIEKGESVALVGESGSGKSVTALAILRLLGDRAVLEAERMHFAGRDLLELPHKELRKIRGGEIGMIFQEPMSSLNPVFRVGDQIAEVLELHRGHDRGTALKEAAKLLDRVGIPSPESRVRQYPHELSGGMKQRVMIAMALACDPELLIADEPTTALDVTIQAQILELLEQLRRELGMAILLITHDLGVVAQFSERVMVMYAGQVVEHAEVGKLFRQPAHPYTKALLGALPRPDATREDGRLEAIEGSVPSPLHYPPGCAFSDRCAEVLEYCERRPPEEVDLGAGRQARCWLYGGSL